MASLRSRPSHAAIQVGDVRISFVPGEPGEPHSIQVLGPEPQNFVLNNPLEVLHILEATKATGRLPESITFYGDDDQPSGEVRLLVPISSLVLDFYELGSATAVLILLLTGMSPQDINWDKVRLSEMTGRLKAPETLESFITWHLKD